MLLEIIGSFASGISHKLGLRVGAALVQQNQKGSPKVISSEVASSAIYSDASDQETWNIVTSYGKYKEIWQIYRNNGLLEAIKVRDEKISFDQRMVEGRELEQSLAPSPQKSTAPQFVQTNSPLIVIPESSSRLDELDLALVRGLSSYFESMSDKIHRYHHHHHASQAEAEVIANFYLKMADSIRDVMTQQDLEKLVEAIKNLKEKVSRYQHESYKYRWSTGLEKEVISKLDNLMVTLKK